MQYPVAGLQEPPSQWVGRGLHAQELSDDADGWPAAEKFNLIQ